MFQFLQNPNANTVEDAHSTTKGEDTRNKIKIDALGEESKQNMQDEFADLDGDSESVEELEQSDVKKLLEQYKINASTLNMSLQDDMLDNHGDR